MTAVGKILVFFNLLFALGVGGLTIASYISRTQWVTGYEKLKKQAEVAQAAAAAHRAEADQAIKREQDLNAKLMARVGKQAEIKGTADMDVVAQKVAKALEDSLEQIKVQKAELDRLNGLVSTEQKKHTEQLAVAQALQKDVERRQADAQNLRTTLKEETDKNSQLVLEKNQLRDAKVASEIQVTALVERNSQLEKKLEENARDLARMRAGASGAGAGRPGVNNPPPENVEGLVKRADTTSGLVTISLGSDAGIARGHTLEVFRFGAVPKYLGKIRIVEVMNNQAVGSPVGKMSSPVQAGDRVASRIMGGGN